MKGFARVAAAVPHCQVADVTHNRERTLALWREADAAEANLVVFPELGLSGYTARDLLLNSTLLDACEAALLSLAREGAALSPVAVVGLPLRARFMQAGPDSGPLAPQSSGRAADVSRQHDSKAGKALASVGGMLYNVAAVLHDGRILGIVPKAYLPSYREFEEARWFRPGVEVPTGMTLQLGGTRVPFGMDLLFGSSPGELVFGIEICEDNWVQSPPSNDLVSAGATVIGNLSGSPFTVGKAELRRLLVRSSSDRGKCAYIYVAAGPGESSTDLAFDGDAFICENGSVLAESVRFRRSDQLVVQDVDCESLAFERRSTTTFGDCAKEHARPFRVIGFTAHEPSGLVRKVSPTPFLPNDPATLARRCWEIFEIQSNALATRMAAIGANGGSSPALVLGVSGGLDSTQAALVAAAALDLAGRPRHELNCITMPGFGTSDGTRENAEALSIALGATFREVAVSESSRRVLMSVGHPAAKGVESVAALIEKLRDTPALGDVTLENVQARLRTLVLMTLANDVGGIVVGTGDLSEKALGWSTYAGDHIAMYDVNAGIPKTLIQFVIRWVANERASHWSDSEQLRKILFDVLDTPISPELLPADAAGRIAQLTETTLGPYELHDFYLYHFVRHGSRPARLLDLARAAFPNERYDDDTLKRWLTKFAWRFFSQQFKRSCTADGPKVGSVALSPRGDWRMPSDARPESWLADIEAWPGEAAHVGASTPG